MMEATTKRELTCIGCPLGCSLTVEMTGATVQSVTGNTCKRGEDYARKEVTDPRRIVTTTVPVEGGKDGAVSVKTVSDIPKTKIRECLQELKKIRLQAPVQIGDIVLENAAGTGIAVAATKAVARTSISK